MSTDRLMLSLLRPPILHILRAAGFTTTRPSVLDALVDITSRYLLLLSQHTARHHLLRSPHASPIHDTSEINITDIRLAMQDLGLLYPQISAMEEQVKGEEDMRGIEGFINWCTGDTNKEIRRIAGLEPDASDPTSQSITVKPVDLPTTTTTTTTADGDKIAVALVEPPREDFLTQLKKRHAKTKDGEEARWQGTVLGKDMGEREIRIEGWDVDTLQAWAERLHAKNQVVEVRMTGTTESESDSPLTDYITDTGG